MKSENTEYEEVGAAVVAARQNKEILNALGALADRLKKVEEVIVEQRRNGGSNQLLSLQ
jgi:hypothetical protein